MVDWNYSSHYDCTSSKYRYIRIEIYRRFDEQASNHKKHSPDSTMNCVMCIFTFGNYQSHYTIHSDQKLNIHPIKKNKFLATEKETGKWETIKIDPLYSLEILLIIWTKVWHFKQFWTCVDTVNQRCWRRLCFTVVGWRNIYDVAYCLWCCIQLTYASNLGLHNHRIFYLGAHVWVNRNGIIIPVHFKSQRKIWCPKCLNFLRPKPDTVTRWIFIQLKQSGDWSRETISFSEYFGDWEQICIWHCTMPEGLLNSIKV